MADYGSQVWWLGQRYAETDSNNRVPMRQLVHGAPGDQPARPRPVVPNERQTSTIAPRNPTLAQRLGAWVAGDTREGAQGFRGRLGGMVEGVADMSTLQGLQDLYRSFTGDSGMDPRIAAMGLIPGGKAAGKLAKGALTETPAAIARMGHNGGPPLAGPMPEMRIAQRVATSADPANRVPGDIADVDAMRQDPEFFRKASDRLQGIVPDRVMTSGDPEERFGHAQTFMINNLRQLYDRMDPGLRERAIQWYPGGNKMAHELSQRGGITPQAAAGTIASLSPQKDWFQNVEMARRMIESQAEDPRITREMLDRAMGNASEGLGAFLPELEQHLGTRLSQLGDRQAAIGTLAHDWATRSKDYPILTPEGGQMGIARSKQGPQPLAWSSIPIMERAIRSARSGGDLDILSQNMGGQHKVRNFYNNIISPDPRFNDYTSDTHNIAASLMVPVGGSDPRVAVGLGAAPSSSSTGMKGLYGLYADAGRGLAKEKGVAAYQVQSPTWEGIRSLFPAASKKGMSGKAEAVWDAYRKGEITQEAAQEAIFKMSKTGVNRIPWAD